MKKFILLIVVSIQTLVSFAQVSIVTESKTLPSNQLFLGKSVRHWIDYYVVEIIGDTAVVENFEFFFSHARHTKAIEKLTKTDSKDTLFSNGKTKIVSKNGKKWICWGQYKQKLEDYTHKKVEIEYIRNQYALKLSKNIVIANLNQILGESNYDLNSLHDAERNLSIEIPKDSALKVFQLVAEGIIANEKTRVDFFKPFISKEHLSQSDIISFLNATSFSKQIEKDILQKIIINDIEVLSQVVENQDNKKLEIMLQLGVNEILKYPWLTKDCRNALKKSTYQSRTKRSIKQKMNAIKIKETLRDISTITGLVVFYGLLIKFVFF